MCFCCGCCCCCCCCCILGGHVEEAQGFVFAWIDHRCQHKISGTTQHQTSKLQLTAHCKQANGLTKAAAENQRHGAATFMCNFQTFNCVAPMCIIHGAPKFQHKCQLHNFLSNGGCKIVSATASYTAHRFRTSNINVSCSRCCHCATAAASTTKVLSQTAKERPVRWLRRWLNSCQA